MRIKEIHIERWRNLRDVHIVPPEGAQLVCLVGENGTGKSGLLELIAEVSGLLRVPAETTAQTSPRPVLSGDYHVDMTFDVGPLGKDWDPVGFSFNPGFKDALADWDRSFRLSLSTGIVAPIVAGGIIPEKQYGLFDAAGASNILHLGWLEVMSNASPRMSTLLLGPDRFFSSSMVHPDAHRGRMPSDQTPQLQLLAQQLVYELIAEHREKQAEWEREALQKLNNREAVQGPGPAPGPAPSFPGLETILPHLGAPRIDVNHGDIVFDVAGDTVPLSSLSSGEKDVLVTALYLQRYEGAANLLLIDEPELHLHPDLARRRLEHLRDNNPDGQTWITTHSFEAVDVAGDENAFVLQRDADYVVRRAIQRSENPAFALLADSLGMPAFALARRRFVFVEDTIRFDKINRFLEVFGTPGVDKFISVMGRENVEQTLRWVGDAFARDSAQQVRVCGLLDRDLMTDTQVAALESRGLPVHVLGCHELENVFLQPELLDRRSWTAPDADLDPTALVRSRSDLYAGMWITKRAKSLQPSLPWGAIFPQGVRRPSIRLEQIKDAQGTLTTLLGAAPVPEEWLTAVEAALGDARDEYLVVRDDRQELAKTCCGKEVLREIFRAFGDDSVETFIKVALRHWTAKDNPVPWPPAVTAVRSYLEALPSWSPEDVWDPTRPPPPSVIDRNAADTSVSSM